MDISLCNIHSDGKLDSHSDSWTLLTRALPKVYESIVTTQKSSTMCLIRAPINQTH